ncbi:MAG: PEP-CTERM sorting domain-containing protein [Thermodesulfobacteriota bacterium]|jgi:hypothetical protein|nr:PEP-CTERM sorting domain-containing protein [Thermodesulfobacteriota bacterium]
MKKIVVFLSAVSIFLVMAGPAMAVSFDATLTADNHYALFYGNENGVNFVGHNELGDEGSTANTYNWSEAETWQFNADLGDYIYVAVWSDDAVAQGLIGEFVADTYSVLTNTSDWEVLITGLDKDGEPAPSAGDLEGLISGATWSTGINSLDHGSDPWGQIAGIDVNADWIWGGALVGDAGVSDYQIFRTQVTAAPVPEPASMLLLGTGLTGLGIFGRRLRKKR